MPAVEEEVQLPPDETEDSEVIEVEVRGHRRRIRRKRYRRTCDCSNESQTLIAPAPPKLILKGRYGVSVWVHLLLAKFASHRALGNAIEALSHYDLDLPQGTITDGLKRISPMLEPVYEAILARNAESFYHQADETRWSVFVEQVGVGKGWPELVDWAIAWLHRIRRLYHLNRQRLLHEPNRPQFARHDAALREAIDAMHQQATEELARPKLRQPCRKALVSLLDHWPGLTLFVDDPKIPMDNNASERMVRGPAMGRKNYFGSGSLWSVCLTAAMFSIVATLKQWNVNPRRWLLWYLESCAAAGSRVPEDIERFLPWNLTADRRAELIPPEASVPLNDSS